MIGGDKDLYLLATSSGYGFLAMLGDLQTRQRAGKAVVTVPPGGRVLSPLRVEDPDNDFLAAVTDAGRLLIFPVGDLPLLPRGKGVKIISLPSKGEKESLLHCAVFADDAHLIVHSGKRYLNLKPAEWEVYAGKRALRGNLLPRGYRIVARLEVSA
jgi:topoisomerase-4 subunit A